MKQIVIRVVCMLFVSYLSAQVAIINDPDGWTNVRAHPDKSAKVIHKVHEDEVFWFDEESYDNGDAWITVYLPKNRFNFGNVNHELMTGYIHHSRIQPLLELTAYSGDAFYFKYLLDSFYSDDKILDRDENGFLQSINGQFVWGVDGWDPKVQVEAIQVRINGIEVPVHPVFFSDIFECRQEVEVFKVKDTYFVHQINSDGVGAYELVWVFDSKGLKQRLVGSVI